MYTSAKKKPRKPRVAKPVSELIGKIMEPVLARRTGMSIDLLAAWPELVGEDYRNFTHPQKIKWPNRAHQDDPFKPGILIVACDSTRALYFQHDLSRLCERVNVFFGFTAIAKIKIVQKPVGASPKTLRPAKTDQNRNLDRQKKRRLDQILDKIDDPNLRERLAKLGRGVMSKTSTS